jgi:radical SAM protein with 4Fe4S-binding SPASM domain
LRTPWLKTAGLGEFDGGPDISWIYGFWRQVRDYVYVREEDDVVILPPNKVYKTNPSGAAILRFLDSGGHFGPRTGFDEAKLYDIERFMKDIKAIYDGQEVSMDSVAYDFDFTRLPVLGEIAITYRCNNSCRFCYAGCGEENRAKRRAIEMKDLGTASLKKLISIFKKKAKIPFFSFTGGEPLLRDDIEELIRYSESLKLRVNLITNGTLATPERAKSLFDAGLRTAQVSLESPDPEIHDRLCGVSGAWDRTMAGIRSLKEAGISVQTNSTTTSANMASLLGMPEFLASIGVMRFSMNLFIPSKDNPNSGELFVSYSEIGEFVDEVKRSAAARGLTFFWYSPTPLCIYNPVARGLGNKNCAAADGLISVDPEGNVLPCSSYPEPLGNLLSDNFENVWFSARALHFKHKQYAPESCQSCASFNACQAACPLYWAFAGYGELEGRCVAAEKPRQCAVVEES